MNAELQEKIDRAIEVLRENEPKDGKGYALAFSGGKDSCVIKQLAIEAGVKFNAFYSVTTIDPPELVRFIKEHHKDVEWLRPKRPMLIEMSDVKLFPPNQFCRWCCSIYKEQSKSEYSVKIIGVRASESIRRAKRWAEVVQNRNSKKRKFICPIVYWTDDDVWSFVKERKLPYCSLYDEGFTRLGCIGCPLSGTKNIKRDFERWKGFENAWRMAFRRMYANCQERKLTPKSQRPYYGLRFKSGDEWFEDYIGNAGRMKIQETCQMELMFTGVAEEEAVK